MNTAHAQDDLVAQVRGGDYDRFLAIQLAPSATRGALYAMVAFHIEIARIAELVSEPLVGHIRLAWWREALEEIAAGKAPRNHPVVLALAEVYARHAGVFTYLHEMLEARAADLDTSLMAEEAAWREYCNHTAGALHMAMACVVDKVAAKAQEQTIRTQALAYAMIGMVRAIAFMAAQGWQRLPHARLDAHGVASLAPSAALNAMVQEVVTDAEALLARETPAVGLKMMDGLLALTRLYGRKLQHAGYDPYGLKPSKLRAVWQVLKVKYISKP
jgi:NADH dehydrogenase [ubiquinone] 1 alpha subcomplex assembly factor 6